MRNLQMVLAIVWSMEMQVSVSWCMLSGSLMYSATDFMFPLLLTSKLNQIKNIEEKLLIIIINY